MTRAVSEGDLKELSVSERRLSSTKSKSNASGFSGITVEEERRISIRCQLRWTGFYNWDLGWIRGVVLRSCKWGLEEEEEVGVGSGAVVMVLVEEEEKRTVVGIWVWDENRGRGSRTDVYYEKTIEANPRNALILSNYARY